MDEPKLHVVMISSPGMGHLTPVLLLGERLLAFPNIHVTILVVTTAVEFKLPSSITRAEIVKIGPVNVSNMIKPDTQVVTKLVMIMREALPGIRSAIAAMKPRADVLIADPFSTGTWPIADAFHLPKYVYVGSTAWLIALTAYCSVLDEHIEGQYVDQEEPLQIPGCKSVRPEDVVDPMLDRRDQQYREYLRQGIELSLSDGILMNTWEDLEGPTLKALRTDPVLNSVVKAPVYPVGPLYKLPEPGATNSELFRWLDEQPANSVLLVSFGSGGTLSAKQTTELAWGLELSKQRFVWVVRQPNDGDAAGSFFSAGSWSDGTPDYLPGGFITRIKGTGFIVPGWAPQVEILSHLAAGGFLTHCGWNSISEAIASGVPMIAWPLYAEQRMNATMLAEELKVAIRPAVLPTKKVVRREEIEGLVRALMKSDKGREMRERVRELKQSGEAAANAGGSSNYSILSLIKEWKMRLKSESGCSDLVTGK